MVGVIMLSNYLELFGDYVGDLSTPVIGLLVLGCLVCLIILIVKR